MRRYRWSLIVLGALLTATALTVAQDHHRPVLACLALVAVGLGATVLAARR